MKTRSRCDRRGLRTPAGGVFLAGLLAVSAVGCKTIPPRPAGDPAENGSSSLNGRTDFRAEVGHDREVSVHLDLARAFEVQGNDEAALTEYQRAVEVAEGPAGGREGRVGNAQRALAQRRMANVLDRLGRFAQAETHYREALRQAPDDPRVWNDAGYSYYLQHRWAEAERTLLSGARIAPDDPKIQTNLGLCLAAAGKTDEALAALTRAGGPVVAQANLGFILAATDRRDEARAHYQAALAIAPDFEAARFALARLDAEPVPRSPLSTPTAIASTRPEAPSTIVSPEPLILTGGSSPMPVVPTGVLAPLPILPPEADSGATPGSRACARHGEPDGTNRGTSSAPGLDRGGHPPATRDLSNGSACVERLLARRPDRAIGQCDRDW